VGHNESQNSSNLKHFSLVCQKHSELLRVVHFAIKYATIYGPRSIQFMCFVPLYRPTEACNLLVTMSFS